MLRNRDKSQVDAPLTVRGPLFEEPKKEELPIGNLIVEKPATKETQQEDVYSDLGGGIKPRQ